MKIGLALVAMAAVSVAATSAYAQEKAAEREIRKRMVACGIPNDRLTLWRDAELRQDYVAIAEGAPPSDLQLKCAASLMWRTRYMADFRDEVVAKRFLSKLTNGDPAYGSGAVATARRWLGEKGLLNKLPDFASLAGTGQVARALETFCGVAAGALPVDGSTINIDEATGQFEGDRTRCISAAAIASGLPARGVAVTVVVRP